MNQVFNIEISSTWKNKYDVNIIIDKASGSTGDLAEWDFDISECEVPHFNGDYDPDEVFSDCFDDPSFVRELNFLINEKLECEHFDRYDV